MPQVSGSAARLRCAVRDGVDGVIAEHYESLKPEVLATVRGKLADVNLHPDPLDLDAAYNAAWHAFYEQCREDPHAISNLGGWLARIAHRRAIDDIRSARLKYRGPPICDERISEIGYEHDVDDELSMRQRYHQWLLSLRLRLSERERRAVSLCVLHEHSRREASDIMGIDIKRLDKIMVEANRKLGGLLEAINRGDWCREQRSLIKAFALGLHEHGGERHALAAAHVMECQACAAYVRSVRGLAAVVPAPTLIASGVGAGGGIAGTLSSLFGGGSSGATAAGGTAAGGGGAALLSGIGAKTAALCVSAVCALSGAAFVVERAHDAKPPSDSASASGRAHSGTVANSPTHTTPTTTSSSSHAASSSSKKRTALDPKSKGAQEVAELGIEPQATSTEPTSAASVPRPPDASEFGIGP
jgi:RNA polymerase sigma factor (sigma-70 family)